MTALEIANCLGVGKRQVAEALFQGSRAGLRPRADLVPGRTVHAGAIEADLPDLSPALAPFASRNNRLAQLVLNEIEAEIDAAIAHFGRDRIAVVMGTSTSGIADGETAFAFHAAQGVWPQGYDYRLPGNRQPRGIRCPVPRAHRPRLHDCDRLLVERQGLGRRCAAYPVPALPMPRWLVASIPYAK